ncbi:exopolyphosphatase PRUNE1 [Notechis scutatus]|uniref:Exopolyphosphatase PRUNE1 n=1 Tax=Notechis scutatus TaxID=8663 RepID=A0A6J1VMA8_9SAUR|nr:exopolyphosphatase PRUNE1 [Notechis scutatus]
MERFLTGCRAALQDHSQSGQAVHAVMGNEACDLDSTVSALVLAYFLAKTSPDSRAAFVPVLNIPRADFPLRTETTFLLLQQRIPEKVLVFRDEIDLAGLHKAGLLTLTLVDHHILPSKDSALEAVVVEVVDHRPLEWERPPPCKVTVELVGSCTTLVTERLLQARVPTLDGQIAALLYGTILLDCVNLAVEAGKVTPRDACCISRLESMFSELQPRNRVFDALQRAKFDVSGLTTEQMLRKDLKSLVSKAATVALSALYMSLQDFLHRPGLEQDLATFCHQKGFGLLIAMAISFGDHKKPFRELAVYSPQAAFQEAVCQALEGSTNPSLGLSRLETPCPAIRAYQQGNIGASRKKLLPIVQEFLHQWGRSTQTSPGMQPEISRCVPPARMDPQGAGRRDPSGAKDAPKAPRLSEEAAEEDTLMPPTPMNSLVDECPLHQGLPGVSPEAIFERVNRIATDRLLDGRSPEKKK